MQFYEQVPGHRRDLAATVVALLVLVGALIFAAAPAEAGGASTGTGCLPSALKSTLSQLRAKFGPLVVVSTNRPGARIAGSGNRSYHASCRAVDFHPPGAKKSAVLAWLRSNFGGGIGTYSCGMHHIHIDNGPKVRWHKCVNAYGSVVHGGSSRKHRAVARSAKSKARKVEQAQLEAAPESDDEED